MRILDKYIIKELTLTFLAVLTVLLLITFGNEASRLLAEAMQGKVPSSVVVELLFLKLPPALEIILPLVALLAVILTFGRLYQDQEMVVLQSSGVSPQFFKKVVALFLLPLVVLMASISLFVTPWTYQQEREILSHAQSVSPVTGLEAGKFNNLPNGQGVLYAKEIDADGELKNIWLQLDTEQNNLLLSAPRGHFKWIDKRVVIVLENGKSYQGVLDRETMMIQAFERFEGFLPELTPEESRAKVYEKTTLELFNGATAEELAILQWRIVTPIGVFILGLIGLKMSQSGPREGRFSKLLMAFVLYIVFNQFLVVGRDAIADGEWPASIGLWPIIILFGWYALHERGELSKKYTALSKKMIGRGGVS